MKAAELVEHLQLSKHVEGGYFRRLYEGQKQHEGHHDMTAIYYLLTGDSPVDRWHINKSDIFHSHIRGGASTTTSSTPTVTSSTVCSGSASSRGRC